MQAERLTGRARAMNEQQRFTQAQLTRSIWSVSHRIAELQRQLLLPGDNREQISKKTAKHW